MFDSWIYWAASAACEKSCLWNIICVSEANRRPALDCVNSLRIDLLIRWSISVLLYCTCSIYQPHRSVTSVPLIIDLRPVWRSGCTGNHMFCGPGSGNPSYFHAGFSKQNCIGSPWSRYTFLVSKSVVLYGAPKAAVLNSCPPPPPPPPPALHILHVSL